MLHRENNALILRVNALKRSWPRRLAIILTLPLLALYYLFMVILVGCARVLIISFTTIWLTVRDALDGFKTLFISAYDVW